MTHWQAQENKVRQETNGSEGDVATQSRNHSGHGTDLENTRKSNHIR